MIEKVKDAAVRTVDLGDIRRRVAGRENEMEPQGIRLQTESDLMKRLMSSLRGRSIFTFSALNPRQARLRNERQINIWPPSPEIPHKDDSIYEMFKKKQQPKRSISSDSSSSSSSSSSDDEKRRRRKKKKAKSSKTRTD